jgi:biopolymer transport protein ExbB/TolQ
MDNFLALLGRIPGQGWAALAIVTLVWTYPRRLHQRTVAGVVLDDRLSIWFASIVVIGLMVVVGAVSFFVLRSVLHYLEQGRWPRRAAGVEMDEMTRAESQLNRDAVELSRAADEIRKLRRVLKNSRDTIVYLKAELANERGSQPGRSDESQRLAKGE